MNEADSRYLAERALSSGYEIIARPDDANVVVVNTCTVRDSAERRAYGRLGQLKALKSADPTVRIVVCGCLAEQDRATLRERLPYVDALYGTKELPALGDQIAAWSDDFGTEEVVTTRALLRQLGSGSVDGIVDAFTPLRAYVNVQYGCSYYCTYCIVPHVRGRFEHRPLAEILDEARARILAGAREVTLVGQTVNAYREPSSGMSFAGLLEAVAALPGLDRLGFITSHPKDLDDALIAALGRIPALHARLHLALQSGSNPVLRRMNRKYTIEQYRERIAAFRTACPDWALTTDIIVGFPGESEDDFAQTLAIVDEGLFAQVYAFQYSPRRGTPAARWESIAPDIVRDRFERLMEAVNRHVTAYHRRKLGRVVRALATGPSRKDPTRLAAKTSDNVTVVVPILGAPQRFAATPWLEVEITAAGVWGCNGRLLGVATHEHASLQPVPEVPPTPIDLIAA